MINFELMDVLNEFNLTYDENFLSTTVGFAGSGKSAVFEKIMIDYIEKGFDCLCIGEYNRFSFYKRIQRKMEQYQYLNKDNQGKIIYEKNFNSLNECYIEKLIQKYKPRAVFLDYDMQFIRSNENNSYYTPRSLLLETKIKKTQRKQLTNQESIRFLLMNLRFLINKYNVSFYLNKNSNKRHLIDDVLNSNSNNTNIFMASGFSDAYFMESDLCFGVNKSNLTNTELKILKNRFGSENKKVEILL